MDMNTTYAGINAQQETGKSTYQGNTGVFAFAPGESFMDLLNTVSSKDDYYKPQTDPYKNTDDNIPADDTTRAEDISTSLNEFMDDNDLDSEKLANDLQDYLDENEDIPSDLREKIKTIISKLEEYNAEDVGDVQTRNAGLIAALEMIKKLDTDTVESIPALKKADAAIDKAAQANVLQIHKDGAITIKPSVSGQTEIAQDATHNGTETGKTTADGSEKTAGRLPTEEELAAFQDFLNHLLRGIPQEQRPEVIELPRHLLGKALHKLNASADGTDGTPELIATELTPETLDKLVQDIMDQSQQNDAVIVGFVKMSPPATNEAPVIIPHALMIQTPKDLKLNTPQQNAGAQNGQITGKLNALTAPQQQAQAAAAATSGNAQQQGVPQQTTENGTPQSLPKGGEQATAEANANATKTGINGNTTAKESAGFDRILQMMQDAQKPQRAANTIGTKFERLDATAQSVGQNTQQSTADIQNAAAKAAAKASGLNITAPASGSLTANPASLQGYLPDGMLSSYGQMSGGATVTQTLGSTAQLASPITQAQHATHPHPSAQNLAVKISKAAAPGENKNISIRMDPPDLGKVNVEIEVSKDSSRVKAHLVVEKPETLAMLQRDAHTLEKALQDSGLDSSGADLSFELAQDGNSGEGRNEKDHNFGQGNQKGASGDAEDEEITETTIEWRTDPQTGLTRYDILV